MPFEKERKHLIETLRHQGIINVKVLNAIMMVHRHLFVPKGYQSEAYSNYPLPLGQGQTISQPYTVAFMLEALELKPGQKILEIGTGSGWNAALLAYLTKPKGKIITTEIHEKLIKTAKANIKKTNLKHLKIIKTDGSQGYAKEAPYDRIISTASAPALPQPWINQLKEGGIIVSPIGQYTQVMVKAQKTKGKIKEKELGYFQFVPLLGEYGF